MKLRKRLSFIVLALFIFQSCTQKPNIILIMTDDQGWYDTGFNGNNEIRTPSIDKLATNGIILDRFYSASAVCSPTRASVITGRNPLRINIPGANSGSMKDEEITLPEILKKEGYSTAHFGKWHLGTLTKTVLDANRGGRENSKEHYSIPTSHGYDEYFCSEAKVPTYDPMIYPLSFDTENGESKHYGWKAVEDNQPTSIFGTAYWTGPGQKVTTNLNGDDSRVIMDRVIPFIEKSASQKKPFFTTIWLHTPHLPVVSDKKHREYFSKFDLKKQIYYGTIAAMDEQVGRLWEKLEELNIDEETIIWFCSDNGPERNTPGSAGVFRERKRSLYEGGVRVPAFVIWKDHLEKGKRMKAPSVTSDYLPTLLDILNIDYPSKHPIDGESILSLLEGKSSERQKPIGFIYNKKISWVNNQYKLISTDNGNNFELYDLINDPSEANNIIKEEPEIAGKMKTELDAWLKSVENSKNGLDYK